MQIAPTAKLTITLGLAQCVDVSGNCSVNEVPASKKEKKNNETSHDWLYVIYVAATVIGVIGGWVLLCIVWRQTRATENAANAAKTSANVAVSSQRAWIMAEIVSAGPISFDDVGMRILFEIKCTNVGQSPAMNITIHHRPVVGPDADLANIQKETAPKIRPSGLQWGATLFPGKDFTQEILATVERAELDRNLPDDATKRNIRLKIVGCVDYALGSSRDYHQTFFAYAIVGIDINGEVEPLADGFNVTRDRLRRAALDFLVAGAN